MSEWKPIETAPVGVPVKLGKWRVGFLPEIPDEWQQSSGIARERALLGAKPTSDGKFYTHWMPLPKPPEASQ